MLTPKWQLQTTNYGLSFGGGCCIKMVKNCSPPPVKNIFFSSFCSWTFELLWAEWCMCDVSLTLEGCFHIVVAESAKYLCLEADPGPVFIIRRSDVETGRLQVNIHWEWTLQWRMRLCAQQLSFGNKKYICIVIYYIIFNEGVEV